MRHKSTLNAIKEEVDWQKCLIDLLELKKEIDDMFNEFDYRYKDIYSIEDIKEYNRCVYHQEGEGGMCDICGKFLF